MSCECKEDRKVGVYGDDAVDRSGSGMLDGGWKILFKIWKFFENFVQNLLGVKVCPSCKMLNIFIHKFLGRGISVLLQISSSSFLAS